MSLLKKIALASTLPIVLNLQENKKPINLLSEAPILQSRANKDKKDHESKRNKKDTKNKNSDDDDNNGGGGLL